MPAPSTSLHTLNAFLARFIVRLWPDETKQWGQAFEAELAEISTPLASLRWLMGGVMLLGRETLRHFLKSLTRPLGVRAPNAGLAFSSVADPALRLPRAIVGLFLLVSAAMLCLPEVRASLSSSVLFDRMGVNEYFHERHIRKLRQEARTNHDPQLLAYLSLELSHDHDRFQLAEEAIRHDPSLTWIDYLAASWFWNDTDRSHFLSDERIARLQEFDPQNGLPLLLSAAAISHPIEAAYYRNFRGSALEETPSWEHEVAKNSAWLAAMDRVFSAPRFHRYSAEQIELVHRVSDRYRLSAPDVEGALLASGFWDYSDIRAYSRILLANGDKAAENGKVTLAVRNYEKVQRLAEEIRDGGEYDADRWLAAEIGGKAAKKLQAQFEAMRFPAEARVAAAKLAGWNQIIASAELQSARWREGIRSGGLWHPWQEIGGWSGRERAGLFINLAALQIIVLFPTATLVLLIVGLLPSPAHRFLGRFYRIVCLVADAAPILLISSFAVLFFAYHPYANPFQNSATRLDILMATHAARVLPQPMGYLVYLLYVNGSYYFWVGFTAALCAIVLFLLYRMFARRLRQA